MAYFNHAFNKAFLLRNFSSITPGGILGTPGNTLGTGDLAMVDPSTWTILDPSTPPTTCCNIVMANGSLYSNDKIGPFHGGYLESNKSKTINPRYVSRVYTVEANLPQQMVVNVGFTPDQATADCCKEFLCGETYNLRVDLKGSPALRLLNHNAYLTVAHYTGCCPDDAEVPTPVDPTGVMIGWATQIMDSPILNSFVLPVVTGTTDGGATWTYYYPNNFDISVLTPILGVTFANYSDYVAVPFVQGDTCAGIEFFGAYVDTKFGDCTFQLTDFYEKEAIRIYVSEVDLNGDPCTFNGLCVSTFCEGLQANGLGETVLRELTMSESYRQNFLHSDLRIREITQGDQIISAVDRNRFYDRLYLQHNVPRFNNPTGTFDNDQYLLQVFALAGNQAAPNEGTPDGTLNTEIANLYTWLEGWLTDCGNTCNFEQLDATLCPAPSVPIA